MIFIVIGFIVFLLFIKFYSPKMKGWFGEKSISNRLVKLDSEKYIILNDIILKTEKGTLTQIDHIVVSTFGIFVIETKNYAGMLFGKEKDKEWIQVLNYGKIKNKLYNPVKQNYTHVYKLKKVLNFNAFVFSL